MKAQQNRASDQMQKITDLLCTDAMTAMELSKKLDMSASLVSHYIRRLIGMGCVKFAGMDVVGSCNARAKVWTCIKKPELQKFDEIEKPKKQTKAMPLLTRWIGKNPFERITT